MGWQVLEGDKMERRFFGQVIEVERDDESRAPVAFAFKGERHEVAEVLTYWQDHGFPNDGRKHRWIQRRHRNYYRVRTAEGRVFEIYFDRGVNVENPKYLRWYVTKELGVRSEE